MNMSTPNPLMPQGALQKPISKGKQSFYYAFLIIFTLHLLFFGGLLLMQGCKREQPRFAEGEQEEMLPPRDPFYEDFSELPDKLPVAPGDTGATGAVEETSSGSETTPGGRRGSPSMNPLDSRRSEAVSTEQLPPEPESGRPPVQESLPEVSGESPGPPAPSRSYKEYSVRPGDSFYVIAKRFPGVSTHDIERANPDVNPRRLQVGQTIVIPTGNGAASAPRAESRPAPSGSASPGRTYTVQAGDNLTKIAGRFKTSVERLKEANNLRSDRINIGQKLVVPGP